MKKLSINYLWDDGSTVADRCRFPSKRTNQYQLIIDDPFCSDTYSVYANVNVDFVDAKPTSNPSLNYGPHPVIVNGDAIQIFLIIIIVMNIIGYGRMEPPHLNRLMIIQNLHLGII